MMVEEVRRSWAQAGDLCHLHYWAVSLELGGEPSDMTSSPEPLSFLRQGHTIVRSAWIAYRGVLIIFSSLDDHRLSRTLRSVPPQLHQINVGRKRSLATKCSSREFGLRVNLDCGVNPCHWPPRMPLAVPQIRVSPRFHEASKDAPMQVTTSSLVWRTKYHIRPREDNVRSLQYSRTPMLTLCRTDSHNLPLQQATDDCSISMMDYRITFKVSGSSIRYWAHCYLGLTARPSNSRPLDLQGDALEDGSSGSTFRKPLK